MTPRGKIERLEVLLTIIGTQPGLRISEHGRGYKTGQKLHQIQYCNDILRLVDLILEDLEHRHGIKRADRFSDWLQGRRISSFNWRHRLQINEDRDELCDTMRQGGYDATKKS